MAVIRALDRLIYAIITVLYASIIIAMFSQVFFRYVLGSPFTWSEEISRYMFIWLTYLGAYVAILRNAHIGVDYLTRGLPLRLQRHLSILLSMLVICALAFVAYIGLWLTLENVAAEWQTIPVMSMAFSYAAVPAGACLMLIGLVRAIIRQFTQKELWSDGEPGKT